MAFLYLILLLVVSVLFYVFSTCLRLASAPTSGRIFFSNEVFYSQGEIFFLGKKMINSEKLVPFIAGHR